MCMSSLSWFLQNQSQSDVHEFFTQQFNHFDQFRRRFGASTSGFPWWPRNFPKSKHFHSWSLAFFPVLWVQWIFFASPHCTIRRNDLHAMAVRCTKLITKRLVFRTWPFGLASGSAWMGSWMDSAHSITRNCGGNLSNCLFNSAFDDIPEMDLCICKKYLSLCSTCARPNVDIHVSVSLSWPKSMTNGRPIFGATKYAWNRSNIWCTWREMWQTPLGRTTKRKFPLDTFDLLRLENIYGFCVVSGLARATPFQTSSPHACGKQELRF